MSRIGQKPIKIPQTVTLKLSPGEISVTGPKGDLNLKINPKIIIEKKDDTILIKRKENDRISKSLHGLTRSLIANMIHGVTEGWKKILEIHGTGYKATIEGQNLSLKIGFSHPIVIPQPKDIKFELEGKDKIVINGPDKNKVGQIAAQIRSLKKPDPYKGKGIIYQGEKIRKKPGKAAKIGAGISPAPTTTRSR
jgi:large subunit ribosomal protein L6